MILVDKNNRELYSVLLALLDLETQLHLDGTKETKPLERIAEKSKFGEAGTIVLLDKLEKMGIVKTQREQVDWVTSKKDEIFKEIKFVPDGLLSYTIDNFSKSLMDYTTYVSQDKKLFSKVEELAIAIRKLSKTYFFKRYFIENLVTERWRYSTLSGLENFILGLLRKPLPESKKPVEHKEEYALLLDASKKMNKLEFWDTKINEIQAYFFITPNQKKLLGIVKALIKQGSKTAHEKDILENAIKRGSTKKEALKQLEELCYLGEVYKFKSEHYKASLHTSDWWHR